MSLDDTMITWDMSADGGFGEAYPGLDDAGSPTARARRAGRLLVAPTRTGAGTGEPDPVDPGRGPETVAATFLDPATGEVVDEVVVGRHRSGDVGRAPPSPSARTAAWSPSPGGWARRCSTPAPAR